MDWDLIIVRYGEIGLKSSPVRAKFIDRLMNNIRYSLKQQNLKKYSVYKSPGRIFVEVNDIEKGIKALSFVYGVVSFSPAIEISSNKKELIKEGFEFADSYINESDSFAVITNRVGDHRYSSLEINEELGKEVVGKIGADVDLDNPDKRIYLDIRKEKAFIFKEKTNALMGLPVGVQGKVVSLFSGGIDSPVASSMLLKRGCDVIPLYIKKGKYSSEKEFTRTKSVIKKFSRYTPKPLNLVVVDLEPVFDEIKKSGNRYSCILCKRAMYRVAEEISKEMNCKGIVTGESLGQVASQTLDNLMVLDEATDYPVYRPLISYDKVETMEKSRELGFYKKSSIDVGDCPILPSEVKTKSSLSEVKSLEKKHKLIELTKKCSKNYKKIEF